jgi:hypothetical protein
MFFFVPSKRCAPRRFLSRTLRPDCLAAVWPTKTREGSARRVGVAFEVVQVSLPVVGRLRLVGLHRVPPAVSPFPVAAPGCPGPTHARAFPFEHPPPAFASRSARPTRSGTTRHSSPARTRATSTTRSCLPRTRSFRVPFSGTCGGPLPESPKALHRAVAAKPRHRVPPSWFLTTSAGFSAPQGPGLVASRYQTWGSLRFTFAKRRVYEAPAAGGWADPAPKGGSPTGSSQRRPFEGLILVGSCAASPRPMPSCRCSPPRHDRSRVRGPTRSTCRHARRAGRLQGVAPPTSP